MPQATRVPLVQIDAFSDVPFGGNPAAVCILDGPRESSWMQQVAAEMNLSETAFLYPRQDGFDLRWFTPAIEVDLCGHATLASAHALWELGQRPASEKLRFYTRSGELTADTDGDWIELNFPAIPTAMAEAPPDLLKALGATPIFTGRTRFDYLIEVESEAEVRNLKPDFAALRELPVRGIIVTAAGSNFDFVSRFFAPGSGIDEDPVTGSAHCALGPYWAAKLLIRDLRAYQASPRGGVIRVRVQNDRVILAGQAVTVLRGELLA